MKTGFALLLLLLLGLLASDILFAVGKALLNIITALLGGG